MSKKYKKFLKENSFFDDIYASRIKKCFCPQCKNKFTLAYLPEEDIVICDECGFEGVPIEHYDGTFEFRKLTDDEMNESFEEEYNNCFVEFRDGKPSFAYDNYRDAVRGMSMSRMGDIRMDSDYEEHKYEIKYLEDGIYYDVDDSGKIVKESLKEDLNRAFVELETFKKSWAKLGLSEDDLQDLQNLILTCPDVAVSLGSNVFKVRFSPRSLNKGKNTATRVIYVDIIKDSLIYLVMAFSKSNEKNITPEELDEIRKIAKG